MPPVGKWPDERDWHEWAPRRRRRWRGSGEPLRRDPEDRIAGGVAAGIAAWRGFNVTTVRIVLVVATLVSTGWAVAFYVAAWLLIPAKGSQMSIGSKARHDSGGIALAVGLGSLLSVFLLLAGVLNDGFLTTYGWPQVVSVAGLTLIWRNAAEDEQAAMRRLVEPLESLGSGGEKSSRATVIRLTAAVVLLLAGLAWLLTSHESIALLRPLG